MFLMGQSQHSAECISMHNKFSRKKKRIQYIAKNLRSRDVVIQRHIIFGARCKESNDILLQLLVWPAGGRTNQDIHCKKG